MVVVAFAVGRKKRKKDTILARANPEALIDERTLIRALKSSACAQRTHCPWTDGPRRTGNELRRGRRRHMTARLFQEAEKESVDDTMTMFLPFAGGKLGFIA